MCQLSGLQLVLAHFIIVYDMRVATAEEERSCAESLN
jgi:hypothetical protein